MPEIAPLLLPWFKIHGRKNLPWQQQVSAYRVWLSEIMLQQTQVSTVIPYFEKFIKTFPTIQYLADADLDQVLALWAGLGYYARARNLHKTAQIIRDEYAENFPSTLEQLEALPGIGRSTAGAIASLAMGQSAGILDGNVKRVLCRVFQQTGWPGSTQTQKQLWSLVNQHTPKKETAFYNQAMMDLGSMVCTRSKPACEECPLSSICQSYHQGTQLEYPVRKPKKKNILKSHWFLIHHHEQKILLQKRPPSGIWGGLWCLPEFQEFDAVSHWQIERFGQLLPEQERIKNRLFHRFTHFNLNLSVVSYKVNHNQRNVFESSVNDADECLWFDQKELSSLALPTPMQKLLL